MAGISANNGFEDLANDLEKVAERITDERLKKKALEVGAEPIVTQARSVIRGLLGTRTGNLINSIQHVYNKRTERQSIGWTDGSKRDGFYGFFYEVGYRPLLGRRKGKSLHSRRKTASRGQTIQRQHLKPALDNSREEMFRRMIEVYQKELGGI